MRLGLVSIRWSLPTQEGQIWRGARIDPWKEQLILVMVLFVEIILIIAVRSLVIVVILCFCLLLLQAAGCCMKMRVAEPKTRFQIWRGHTSEKCFLCLTTPFRQSMLLCVLKRLQSFACFTRGRPHQLDQLLYRSY